MPELWLDESNCCVYEKNVVTVTTYQFESAEDAKKGLTIIQKEMDKCLNSERIKPFHVEYAIKACQKENIFVQVYTDRMKEEGMY